MEIEYRGTCDRCLARATSDERAHPHQCMIRLGEDVLKRNGRSSMYAVHRYFQCLTCGNVYEQVEDVKRGKSVFYLRCLT